MKLLLSDKKRKLNSNKAKADKIILTKWENKELTTREACEQFCKNNNLELTEDEFIQYANWLGYTNNPIDRLFW